MTSYFITGTDTDVGKTLVSAWLMLHLDADYWKPIQSGPEHDRQVIKDLTLFPEDRFHPSTYSLHAFLSPNQAAEREDVRIDLSEIRRPLSPRPLLVEGAGGVMVPLNAHDTVLDLIEHLGLPVIVVARTELGTLNHTLLTLEALHNRQISTAGLVLNGAYHPENKRSLEQLAGIPILGEIPPIGELSWQTLKSIPLNTHLLNPRLAS